MKAWLILCIVVGTSAAQATMPLDVLRSTAEQAAPFAPATASLDPRVQVARCEQPLTHERVSVRDRQATVVLRCGQPSWQLYVPVRASGGTAVVVLKRSVAGNTTLGVDDVEQVTRDATAAGYGTFDDVASVLGLQTRRALPAGRVLGPADVIRAPTVRRGDQVAIEVQTAAVTIRMQGEALADGSVGQRIAVKNLSSGKRVEAVVRSSGTVQVPQ
ncbi:flagellar basal body P-ring formation chaperone FlgA [Polycyclovorans algicola]|uniref:flagellar basal body P-ring formation chaperone FlgA n=1 Tax=Polycyclovorans algicola TaxID=616992 RepID=UPI001377287E|nr:flagellar basal body P-ring formation chaperone FlgA [Polycyclovorans algicola]